MNRYCLTIFILFPLFIYGQKQDARTKRQLYVDFCDQVLDGDTLSALTTFQTMLVKHNSNISESVFVRGSHFYDAFKDRFSASSDFISKLEKLNLELEGPLKFNFEECLPFSIQDIEPEYNSGIPELYKKINKNLSLAKLDSTDTFTSKSFVQFVVQHDGKISDVKIVKGDHSIEKNVAETLINTSGQWSPGRCNCQTVSMRIMIPIRIKIH